MNIIAILATTCVNPVFRTPAFGARVHDRLRKAGTPERAKAMHNNPTRNESPFDIWKKRLQISANTIAVAPLTRPERLKAE